jgi:hemoglobin
VQKDEVIAHFFNDVAKVNWEKHLPKMYDFWDSIIRNQHNYSGSPMPVHVALSGKSSMRKEHFERWLQLFYSSLDELFEGEKTELAKTRALSIATVMEIKVYRTQQ